MLLQLTDPQFDRSPRREQQQGNIHIHDRDHHLPSSDLHIGRYVHEYNRREADAAGPMAVLGCRGSIHYFRACCLPLHRAVQVQAPTPLPDDCLLALGTFQTTSR
jgi:hypothetical protein